MTLPRRLPKKPKRDGRLRCPAHLKWVREHECCVTLGERAKAGMTVICAGPIIAAHVRTGTDGGTSLKPGDEHTISLCDAHHCHQHNIGETAFEKWYGIDMKKLAAEFWTKSPHGARKHGKMG